MSTGKSNTSRTIAIVVGVLVVLCLCLVCLAGIAYWQRDKVLGLLGMAQQTQATKMMPPDTPIYMGVSLNLQNQAGYENLKKLYLDNPDVKKALDEAKANATKDTSLVYEQDVQPWLGSEAGLAVFNIPVTGMDSSRPPDVLVAVATRDVKASEAALEKFRAGRAESSGRPFEEGTYEGVTYWFQKAESEFGSDTYIAVFNGFVVFATSEETLFGAIDRVKKGGESLADNKNYQATMAELPKNGAFFAFMDWAMLADMATKTQAAQLTPEQLAQLKAFHSIGLAFTLQPDGVQIDTAILFDPKQLPEAAQAALNRPGSPNAVLKKIPAGALGFYNSSDLRSIWQQAREALAANPDFEQQLADIQEQNGINLDEDVFGWMTGEFALVLTKVQPAAESFAPPVGGYLLIGADDVKVAQDKVTGLVDALNKDQDPPPFAFESQTISGHEMQVLPDPATGGIMGGYGFWDNYLVAGYQEDALKAGFAAPDDPIADSPHFKAVSSRLPGKNYGYFYVDIEAARSLIESQLTESNREGYDSARPFIEPLRAFGVAADAGSAQSGVQKATMFLLITEK
jgi:hypothetical protein